MVFYFVVKGQIDIILDTNPKKIFKPMQTGDVIATSANINNLGEWNGYKPKVNLPEGIDKFVNWYKEYFKI